MKLKVYLLAQGRGLRWKPDNPKKHPRYTRFAEEAPTDKQLLPIRDELLLQRSVRLFWEEGFGPAVVADSHLLDAMPRGIYAWDAITLDDPGDDVLQGALALMDEFPPEDGMTVLAFGDVIFSRRTIKAMAARMLSQDTGCVARVRPSPVCPKVADEVFAIWFSQVAWPEIKRRMEYMLTGKGNRPSKPWAFPFAVALDFTWITATYQIYRADGLKTIEADLVVTDDYTDDIDSPEEWMAFWDGIREAAEGDTDSWPLWPTI